MHRKRGIDRGTDVTGGSGVWGGYPCGVWGAKASGKVTTYVPPTHYYTAPDFFSAFGSASFQSVLAVGLFNCSQPPDVPTMDCQNSICRNKVCRNSVVYPTLTTSSVDLHAAVVLTTYKPSATIQID